MPTQTKKGYFATLNHASNIRPIAATMPQSSEEKLRDNTHSDNSHLLDSAVDSNDQNMDTSPHELEQRDCLMDSTQDAEMGDHHTPQPHCAETPYGAPNHSSSEVTGHFEENNDVCQQKPGTEAGQLPGKRDDLKSRQTPRHPVSLNQTSINEDHTMGNMEASRTQNKDTPIPEDTSASSKRPKNMRFVNCQTHHQKGLAERLGVPHAKMEKIRCQSPRPPSSYPKT